MIAMEKISVRAGSFALRDVSFTVETGSYTVLMGKTGSGKTTLLEVLCGLRRPAAGTLSIMGRDVTRLKAAERNIGYVPQDAALFTTMTVREQLAFGLRLRKWPRQAIADRLEELAAWLGIVPLLGRKPQGLSGGEAQRVALGRALAWRPPVLCLDEPLGALDEDTRTDMCQLLERVKAETRATIIHVTHDSRESARLADQVLRIEHGQVRASAPA